ncbi:hypothetical protein Tco_1290340 [Tanacetum coccineum]
MGSNLYSRDYIPPSLVLLALGKLDFLDSVFFALGFNPSDLRGAELFFGTSKANVSIVLKTPCLPKDTTRITREMDGNTSIDDAVKAFLKSMHLRARPPITKEKLEAGMPCDFYDILAEASSVPIGVRDERRPPWQRIRQIVFDRQRFEAESQRASDIKTVSGRIADLTASIRRDIEVLSIKRKDFTREENDLTELQNDVENLKDSVKCHLLMKTILDLKQNADYVVGQTSTASGPPVKKLKVMFENQPEIIELSKKLSGLINVGNASKSGALKEMQDHENDKEMMCIRSSELSDREKKLSKLANEVSQLETHVAKLKVELDKQNDLLVKLKPETEFTERKRAESRNFTKELEALRRQENESKTTHESYSKRIDEMCMEHSWIVTEEELNISADDYHKAKEDYGELLTKQHEIEPRLVKDVDNRLAELHQQRNELVNVIIPGLTGDLIKIDSNEGEKLKTNCDAVNLYLRQCLALLLPGLSARLQQEDDGSTIFKGIHMNLARNEDVLDVSELSKERGGGYLAMLVSGINAC